jgi:uncharacterized protein YggE
MTKLLMSLFIGTLAISSLMTSISGMAFSGETPSIEVKGQASILAVPDRFSLSMAIVKRGQFTDKIRAVVESKSNQVIQIAQSLGIKNQDINSARIRLQVIKSKPSIIVEGIEANQRVGNTAFSNGQHNKVYVGVNAVKNEHSSKPSIFELTRIINIHFSNIDNYDLFLNKIIKIGVSRISPLAMSVENIDKYYQQALIQAISNAKNKASKIAKHSNVVINKLLYVKELSNNYYTSHLSPTMMSSESAPNHISQVGNQAINASVLVKFSIQE